MKTGLRETYSSYIDLVLVGGGHAQIQVLKSFGMKPETGVRLTLITDVLNTPYSGMLPGHIEGIWSDQDMYINLVKLARFAGARLIHQSVKLINTDTKTIYLNNKIKLKYDVLSVNCGAAPDLNSIPGAELYAVAVKPISMFLKNCLPRVRYPGLFALLVQELPVLNWPLPSVTDMELLQIFTLLAVLNVFCRRGHATQASC